MELNLLEQTIETGVDPLTLLYSGVLGIASRSAIAYRSILVVRSVELGTLMPEQYSHVANRTVQCQQLAKWNIRAVCGDIKALTAKKIKFEWLSALVPTRSLIKEDFPSALVKILEEENLPDRKQLCIEFPADILNEDEDKIKPVLLALRGLGVTVAIRGFADPYCPTLRIRSMPLDIVILDKYIADAIDPDDFSPIPTNVITLAKSQGIKSIMEGTVREIQVAEAYRLNCLGYIPANMAAVPLDEIMNPKGES